MTFFLLTLVALAGLGLAAYMFRDKLEAFAPGWKTTLTNGFLAVAGLVGGITAMLSGVTAQDWVSWGFDMHKASAIVMFIGVLNMVLSFVTKRAEPLQPTPSPPDGV